MAENGCWSDGPHEDLKVRCLAHLRKLHGSLRVTITASTALRGRRSLLLAPRWGRR